MQDYNNITLLRTALEVRGYSWERLRLANESYTLFTSQTGAQWLTHNQRIAYPFTNATVKAISKLKQLSSEFVASMDIAVPYTKIVHCSDKYDDETYEALIQTYGQLIVKPDNASLSRGLTLAIRTSGQLREALRKAHEYSENALVQEQVFGEEIRFTVLKGKVYSALLRQTPRVVGDGSRTIAELISAENMQRSALSMPYLKYPQLTEELTSDDFIRDVRIPAVGEIVELGQGTMVRTGASMYEVITKTHEDYQKIAEQIATKLGVPFIAIDLFVQDHTQPAGERNHWFIESNTAPVLKMYYSCRDGKMFDVLSHLVPLIDDTLESSRRLG